MPTSFNSKDDPTAGSVKAPLCAMTQDRKQEVVAQMTDDVLSKLTGAFFDVCKIEHWTKRDLSTISGINETAINHILAGRRKNLTVETVALLARAMQLRPELVLHDTRPADNRMPPARRESVVTLSARLPVQRSVGALSSTFFPTQRGFPDDLQKEGASAERLAYAQPDIESETSQ
jgi:transcriptional regulator with XRE-family HTH domain